jgi:hypothetical protein
VNIDESNRIGLAFGLAWQVFAGFLWRGGACNEVEVGSFVVDDRLEHIHSLAASVGNTDMHARVRRVVCVCAQHPCG